MGGKSVTERLRAIRARSSAIDAAVLVHDGVVAAFEPPNLPIHEDLAGAMLDSWLGVGSKLAADFSRGALSDAVLTTTEGRLQFFPVGARGVLLLVVSGHEALPAELSSMIHALMERA